jgi:hypothetical protein
MKPSTGIGPMALPFRVRLVTAAWAFFAVSQVLFPQAWTGASFESLSPGPLTASVAGNGWEIQRSGRDSVRPRLKATCLRDARLAHSGAQCLSLSIPQDTVGFEFVTVGRRVRLEADQDYQASVWVRWPDGPDEAPSRAGAVSGHPSAIVSFWARHRDATGEFAGRDEWLFDNRWKRLAFRFRALHPDQPTLVYVSLLPNQGAAATTVLVDDFALVSRPVPAASKARPGSVIADGGLEGQSPGPIASPWHFANLLGGNSILGNVIEAAGKRFFAMRMGRGTSNYESAQLWQMLGLQEGVRYEVSCRMRWDDFAPDAPPPIVNYGMWHEGSRTWYGPVDQTLGKTGAWQIYRFLHVPPAGGRWKLYVQLNGWGNFGRSAAVSFTDFTCLAAK